MHEIEKLKNNEIVAAGIPLIILGGAYFLATYLTTISEGVSKLFEISTIEINNIPHLQPVAETCIKFALNSCP